MKAHPATRLRSATGYGTGAGLCGWNCRHTFGPYIEGCPRVWTDEKLEELKAAGKGIQVV